MVPDFVAGRDSHGSDDLRLHTISFDGERMTLPLDVARCNGARVDNERNNHVYETCIECRRREIPDGAHVRYLLIAPPAFDKGVCAKRIAKESDT